MDLTASINEIINLLESSAGDSDCWCCIDEKGNVVYSKSSFCKHLGYDKAAIQSVLQFNPEWSFIDFKNIVESLKSKKYESMTVQLMNAENEIHPVKIKLIPFVYADRMYIQYIIRNVSTTNGFSSNGYNYDDQCPNPVLYYDNKGDIVYRNKAMLVINPADSDRDNINKLFLESEFGDLVKNLENYPDKNVQVIVRMIMRSKKMIEGFSRLTIHDKKAPAKFRCEFLESDDIQLFDKPLEVAMANLERSQQKADAIKTNMLESNLNDFSFENIITRSDNYKKILRQIAQVADTDTTVLLTGETGTGKELLCNAIYSLSDRSDEIIVKINCASIPKELMESTLFGHEKGSFTGADSQQVGKFEVADKGTIFLDEIGELPLEMQAKLLRVLQEGEIERVGSSKPIKVDVRIIAATNRDLEKLSKKGRFRPDLFYRLNVFPIYNIPLRERKEDIPLLIEHFLHKVNNKTGKKVSMVRNKDRALLENYDYPGNVRELENIIERAVILSEGEELNLESFFSNSQSSGSSGHSIFYKYDEMIKKHLESALELANGKVTGKGSASELLGMNGKTLASKLRKYGIDPNTYKG